MSGNTLDGLYQKIFSGVVPAGKEAEQHEEATVNALCEWAVSHRRHGEHRSLVASRLLEKRQGEIQQEGQTGSADCAPSNEDAGSTCSGNNATSSAPAYPIQALLFRFLDSKAPVQRESAVPEFSSLVLLFSELIRLDVFSHDMYMASLISRGDLSSSPLNSSSHAGGAGENMNRSGGGYAQQDDESRIDADLDRILQRISQQNEMEPPDSPGSHRVGGLNSSSNRHLQYTTHFPLPADENNSHEANQRAVLLFGVGKARKEARHQLKEATKEVARLFSRKYCLDVSEGGKVKKHWSSEYSAEVLLNRVTNLSFYDQHVVLSSAANSCVELVTAGSNHLPLVEHIALLIQMMESAFVVHGLLEMTTIILKDLHDIEVQLVRCQSPLAGSYAPSLSLLLVGVLRRYHCSLLVYPDWAAQCFESLCRLVKPVTNPSECTSADRSILWYLMDLYNASVLLQKEGGFAKAYPKVKAAFHKPMVPPNCHFLWKREFMKDNLRQPKKKVDPYLLRQLCEDSDSRYSLCGNALSTACTLQDPLMVREVAILCAELTAQCNELSGEWLGILKDLCTCPAICCCPDGLPEIRDAVDISDRLVRNNLCSFVSVLIARHAITLEDFVKHAAIPSVLLPIDKKSHVQSEWEAGVQLSCLLLLRLFKSGGYHNDSLMTPMAAPPGLLATTPQQKVNLFLAEEYLLSAAHTFMEVGAVQVILMTLLLLADTQQEKSQQKKGGDALSSSPWGSGDAGGRPRSSEPPLSDILGTSDLSPQGSHYGGLQMNSSRSKNGTDEAASLAALTTKTLTTLCAESWIRELLLRQGEVLCDSLCDEHLTHVQAQRLLRLLCRAFTPGKSDPSDASDVPKSETTMPNTSWGSSDDDYKDGIAQTLQSVDQWSLRGARLDLLLRYKQVQGRDRSAAGDLSRWADALASAIMDVFEMSNRKSKERTKSGIGSSEKVVWLVSPLVERLPSLVQGAILRAAAQVLEYGTWTSQPKEGQPFLALIRICLRNQEEQKDALLGSLKLQLEQFVDIDKKTLYDPAQSSALNNALQLRLSIVGLMLESIQESSTQTQEYSLLLVMLVSRQVVDLSNNRNLLNSVVDMLATLVHTSLVSKADGPTERQDENKKQYYTLCRKLRKEVGEKDAGAPRLIRQLLPIPKKTLEIIVCEANASSKAARLTGDADSKHGLRVVERQRLLPMEVIGGLRNPAPLGWGWFAATKTERKTLKCQDNHRLLLYHTHDMTKPESYYLEHPPIPLEELADNPNSVGDKQQPVGNFPQFASPHMNPGGHFPGPSVGGMNLPSPGAPPMVPAHSPMNPMAAPGQILPPQMGMGHHMPGYSGPRVPTPDEKMMLKGPAPPGMMAPPHHGMPQNSFNQQSHPIGPGMNPRMINMPGGPGPMMGGPPDMMPPHMMYPQAPPPPAAPVAKPKRVPRKRKNSPRVRRPQTPPQGVPPPRGPPGGPSPQNFTQPPNPQHVQQAAGWYPGQGQGGPPQGPGQQQQFFPSQMGPNAAKRPRMSQSKQAISEMIRSRTPRGAPGPGPNAFPMPPQQGMNNQQQFQQPQMRMRMQQPNQPYGQQMNTMGPSGGVPVPGQGNFMQNTVAPSGQQQSYPQEINMQTSTAQQQGMVGQQFNVQAGGPGQQGAAFNRGPYGVNNAQQQNMVPPMRGQYGMGGQGGPVGNFGNRNPGGMPQQYQQQQMRHQQPQMMQGQGQGGMAGVPVSSQQPGMQHMMQQQQMMAMRGQQQQQQQGYPQQF